MPTKLIEVALPLDAINKEAARENFIYRGNPSAIHKWWAQRPLAVCRAVLFAQLVDDPSAHPEQFATVSEQSQERRRLFDLIERLVVWESSNDEKLLDEARAEIRRCYPEGMPPIVDPFCGGGSIPLEAQRLGLKTCASDLNPVAVLITKALTELPQRFIGNPPVHPAPATQTLSLARTWKGTQGLVEDIRYYGEWIFTSARRRIGDLYPAATSPDGRGEDVIAWLWARTITCPNPVCGSTMPLMRSYWLGKKKGREAWLRPIPDPAAKRVNFTIGHGAEGVPRDGTVGRSGAKCLVCTAPVPLSHVRAEAQQGRMGIQMTAIVVDGVRGRAYLPPNSEHEGIAKVGRPLGVPDTELPKQALGFRVQAYGMSHHADLFTDRQLVGLCTLGDQISAAKQQILMDGGTEPYADAVATYLAFAIDKTAEYNCTLVPWYAKEDRPKGVFARQAIPMVWDFVEMNLFSDIGGSFLGSIRVITAALEGLPAVSLDSAVVEQRDAVQQTVPGIVATDPPYYDNIGYADLSDFFYVWLRRNLRDVYPGLLKTILTPKADELVATPFRFDGNRRAADQHFEDGFVSVFAGMIENASAGTPITVFYAFKQSESDGEEGDGQSGVSASTGWEKMLEGLIRAKLCITGTWPMRTERSSRSVGMGTNALASSIVIVCRPRPADAGITDRRGFQFSLKAKLGSALRDLRSGGVAPVDLAQAAIGPGMAVFSSYSKVVESNGEAMSVRTALALINQVLDDVSVEQEGEFDKDSRWAIAWYAEHGMDEGSYGRADDLSRAKNVSVDGLVRAGIVESGGGRVRLLDRNELDQSWDPATDTRLTVWEVTQHLIRRLLNDGESSAAELLSKVGGLGDAARDLAYRLFQIAEAKKWSKEAGPYNALAASWLEISRLAAEGPSSQGTLL